MTTNSSDSQVLTLIQNELRKVMEDQELSFDQAFLRLCISYLGFEVAEERMMDGKDDCGFDFLDHSPTGAAVIQCKCVEFADALDIEQKAGPDLLTDLPRIRATLTNLDQLPPKMNAKLKRALLELKSTLISSVPEGAAIQNGEARDPYSITVYFCYLGGGLTRSAEAEFTKLDDSSFTYGARRVHITYIPVFIPDLIQEKWKESNTKWVNKQGQKREQFEVRICGTAIRDAKSAVFFTKASDLVSAYREIGYQIFESNVRCEIKNSPVNQAIRQSILSHRGRTEFKHLNNGVTILCDSFQIIGPKTAPTGVRLLRPGIINGLQTVKTLADAVGELKQADHDHFAAHCDILVRLHSSNSVTDYRDLVKSTNNQNPMKARNLKSNEPEQKNFEKLFAQLGWFYERKEGAWSAFRSDPKRWSTLPGFKPQDFMNSKIIKKLDNEEVAQAWLSFIGFSEQAVDQKRYLFQQENLYELIFMLRTRKHGSAYNYKLARESYADDVEASPPTTEGLLIAYLSREFAVQAAKSRKEIRLEAIERLGLQKKDKKDQDQELGQDHEYLQGIIIRGMLLLFVEFVGHNLYQAFGPDVHKKMARLLTNGSYAQANKLGNFDQVRANFYEKDYHPDDVLLVMWELYNHCISQMLSTGWLANWQQTANRSKFIYSDATRKPLAKQIIEAEQMFKRGTFYRVWTQKINEAGGVGSFLQNALK